MKDDLKNKFNRYVAFIVIMCITFGLIITKLAYMQIVKAADYEDKVNNKTVAQIPELAPRGNILDVNGNILASNKQDYVVTYNDMDKYSKDFFKTMMKVFKVLDENGEAQADDFPLVLTSNPANKFEFEFKAESEASRRWMQLRFLKDRGFDEQIIRNLYGSKKDKLTDEQQKKVDDLLLKITPQEVFDKLLKDYKIEDIDNPKYTIQEERRFMVVKDAVKMQTFSESKPVVVADNVKKETAFIIMQMAEDLPGIDITLQPVRYYPYGELGSAFLGYISKIPSWQTSKYEEMGYDSSSDYIGMAGLEQAFEDRLKGSKGGKVVKVNSLGRVTEELGELEAYPGQTIQLTINKDVQNAAEKALDETMKMLQARGRVRDVDSTNATRGAAVAIDVNTGAIIALASRPGFDPNLFAQPGGLSLDQYKKYFNIDIEDEAKQRGYTQEQIDKLFPIDKSIKNNTTLRQDLYDILPKPLFNYATLSAIPPGSTFKPMTAVAGLESGVITPYTSIIDSGYFDDGKNFRTVFPVGGYGRVDLAKAIEVSSNPFFMTVGKLLRDSFGDDILAQYAWKFGLGAQQPSGIEISENYGQVYNTKSIQDIFGTEYLWSTMEMLKSGKDSRGNVFPPIDLYNKTAESDELRAIKKQFKDTVKKSIKSGKFNANTYKDLLRRLISADSLYKGKTITDKNIQSIVDAIDGVTVYDANSQLKIGANMYNAAIGQGIDSFTPIQMANYIATLVNGGNRYKLHLVDKILSPDGKVIEQTAPEILNATNIKQSTVDAIKEGMYQVNYGTQGTAHSVLGNFPIKSGGKTGSATFSNTQDEIGRTSYGWYVGFAPFDKPQIAVAAVIFDGGHGESVSAVAKAMYEAYFKDELAKNYPQYKPQFNYPLN